MKNFRNILAAMLLMMGSSAFADDYAYLSIVQEGGQDNISISTIKNITFDSTNMLINLTNGTQQQLPLSGLSKMFFSGDGGGTGIKAIGNGQSSASFLLKDGVLRVGGAEGSQISVYDANGRLVRSLTAREAETEVSLSGLTKGVYIVKVGTETKKMLNK